MGTLTAAVGDAVRAIRRGRVDFRTDRDGNVAVGIGKVRARAPSGPENLRVGSDP